MKGMWTVDGNYVEEGDLTISGDRCRIDQYGTIYDGYGDEVDEGVLGLEEGTAWQLPTICPEDIYPGFRVLIVRDDGGDRGESDYFRKMIFSSDVKPGSLYAYVRDRTRVFLPDFGITADLQGYILRDVFTIEETRQNITLLRAELERTGYENAVEQLEALYPKWLR